MTSRAAGHAVRARAVRRRASKKARTSSRSGAILRPLRSWSRDTKALPRVLSNPGDPGRRASGRVVEQLLARGGSVAPIVGKLLLLLADRDRLVLLPEIAAAYQERLMEHAKVVRAEVVTAIALPPTAWRRSSRGSRRRPAGRCSSRRASTRRSSAARSTRIGSTVYDGSVTRQLEKMKAALVARDL